MDHEFPSLLHFMIVIATTCALRTAIYGQELHVYGQKGHSKVTNMVIRR